MKTDKVLHLAARTSLTLSLLIFSLQPAVHAAGVVSNCTEADLRAAMSGGGVVTFACDGTITLTNTLVITDHTVLDASGHSITLSGGGTKRVLHVRSGVNCTLQHLTVADGFLVNDNGAGLHNLGQTMIVDCTFSNNATVIQSFGIGFGGAIAHDGGSLIILGSTFVGNRSDSSAAAIMVNNLGGGATAFAVTNSTFFGNRGLYPGGSALNFNPPIPASWIVNCTFAWNTNGGIGVAASSSGTQVTMINTIVANSVGGTDCSGSAVGGNPVSLRDGGHNIVSDSSVVMTNATTLRNTDPLLGPLADNGGPTWTMALGNGSPALNQANAAVAPPTDQRGVVRPVDLAPDIGAYESTAPGVRFSATTYSSGEGVSQAAIQIERTGSSTGAVTVVFSASPASATTQDFVPTNLVVSFSDGVLGRTVYVSITNDTQIEPDETVLLELSSPTGAVLEVPSTATLTIFDDDQLSYVSSCDELGLRTALSNGTWIVFNCDGVIALSSPITITGYKILDAGGHNVILDGNNAVRLFNVTPGGILTLKDLTLTRGNHIGNSGGTSTDGASGLGGAVFVDHSELTALGCRFWTNSANGGTGGSGNPSGKGGSALGGAIYLSGGVLNATDCEFVDNVAKGGVGGSYIGPTGPPGTGGQAQGGAIYNQNSRIVMVDCLFNDNLAHGGTGGSDIAGFIGRGGDSAGGAIFSAAGLVQLVDCLVSTNTSLSGQGRSGTVNYNGAATGGAIHLEGGSLTLLGGQFTANGSQVERGVSIARGGAIAQTAGFLEVSQCFFNGNWVLGGEGNNNITGFNPGGSAFGGCLWLKGGTASITSSTLSSNSTEGGPQLGGGLPGAGAGGAVFSSANLQMLNCTLVGNVAKGGAGVGLQGGAYGGGLHNDGGTMILDQVTAAANAAIHSPTGTISFTNAVALGGNLFSTNGVTSLHASVVANSLSGSNSFGRLMDLGHNLSSDASCGFTNIGSLNNADPKLGPLDDYGGPTPTMALLTGSPAIDGGDNGTFPPTDQRGRSRPFGSAPDIGAFESSAPFVIRGRVSGATFVEEVSIQSGTFNTTTTNRGFYSLEGLTGNSYAVTPAASAYLIVPSNRVVSVGPDQVNVDFKAYRWNSLTPEGVSNRVLHLAYAGTNGQSVRVLASSNLIHWVAISTNVIPATNLFDIFDPTGLPARFYRTAQP